ncbi:hypothetical protein EK21DRAFT_118359 [Setomelanomma holmii]|uniref:Uncharacterized protein n=1 Tax=Setomelanomma holmii TaxID=210430 RepID=A0A9P4LGS1_9PLEO|nr:hypothetical protein EK21DRAFT_118359 [Setomelanomma holmii]
MSPSEPGIAIAAGPMVRNQGDTSFTSYPNVHRRRTERVDGLRHLTSTSLENIEHDIPPTDPAWKWDAHPLQSEALRRITCYILWIDAIGYKVLDDAANKRWPAWMGVEALIEQQHGESWNEILRYQCYMTRISNAASSEAYDTKIAKIPHWYDGNSWADYSGYIVAERDRHQKRLADLLNIVHSLRDAICQAAEASCLNELFFGDLKAKLQSLEGHYAVACLADTRGITEERLMASHSEQWWKLDKKPKEDTAPALNTVVAHAYPASTSMRANLIVIVPAVCLLSTIPAALAWKHSSSSSGTTSDSDFYQAIVGATMQLLGLLMLVWPTISHPRLTQSTWV